MSQDEPLAETGDGRRLRWLEHNQARRRVIITAATRALERSGPGEDIQVQQIAEEAGLARTVIYRHFHDRVDLDLAVQRQVCADLGAVLMPTLSYEGRPVEIIRAVVGGLVTWAVDHPTLFWFIQRELPGAGPSPLAEAVERIAEQIEALINTVVEFRGVELGVDDRAALDPWVFGLIGGVFSSVRRWLSGPQRVPGAEVMVAMLAELVWLQINGMAGHRGVTVPDVPLVELLASMATET